MAIPSKMRRLPDGICVCVDEYEEGKVCGQLFNLFEKDGLQFTDITGVLEYIGNVMDRIKFPEATVKARSFKNIQANHIASFNQKEKAYTMDELLQKNGKLITFIITVSSRVNASWQGEVYVVEHDEALSFSSEIELLNLLDSAINKNFN